MRLLVASCVALCVLSLASADSASEDTPAFFDCQLFYRDNHGSGLDFGCFREFSVTDEGVVVSTPTVLMSKDAIPTDIWEDVKNGGTWITISSSDLKDNRYLEPGASITVAEDQREEPQCETSCEGQCTQDNDGSCFPLLTCGPGGCPHAIAEANKDIECDGGLCYCASGSSYLKCDEDGEPSGRRTIRKTGTSSVLVVRVNGRDRTNPRSRATLSDGVFGTNGDAVNLASQYAACSHNKLRFVPATGAGVRDGVKTATINMNIVGTLSEDVWREAERELVQDALDRCLGGLWSFFQLPQCLIQATREITSWDHIMYCLPRGTENDDGENTWIGYAYFNSRTSVYNDEWCTYVSIQMHEVGHNLDLRHSNDAGGEYGDQSCMMGSSYSQDDTPLMCFNPAKLHQLGWFEDCETYVSDGSRTYTVIGHAEYSGACRGSDAVILRVDAVPAAPAPLDFWMDLYVGYNKAVGHNGSPAEHSDQVTVILASANPAQSEIMAGLNVGDEYVRPAGTVRLGSAFITLLEFSTPEIRIKYCSDNAQGEAVVGVSYDGTDPCGPPCSRNSDCDDGVFCNGEERCQGGSCRAGTPVTCPQGNACSEAAQCTIPGIEVETRDHHHDDPNLYVLSMRVFNRGAMPIRDFRVQYYFEVEQGEVPSLHDWFTPYSTASLQRVCGTKYYALELDFAGYTLWPGGNTQFWWVPNDVRIWYQNGRPVDKFNDFSNPVDFATQRSPPERAVFQRNDKVAVLSADGSLIHGVIYPSPDLPARPIVRMNSLSPEVCPLAAPPPPPPRNGACVGTWGDCEASGCCTSPSDKCFEQDQHYAQCRPSCPDGWTCTVLSPGAVQNSDAQPSTAGLANWAKCFPGDCCADGIWGDGPYTCYRYDSWYAQCRPVGNCPPDWDCYETVGARTQPRLPAAGYRPLSACGGAFSVAGEEVEAQGLQASEEGAAHRQALLAVGIGSGAVALLLFAAAALLLRRRRLSALPEHTTATPAPEAAETFVKSEFTFALGPQDGSFSSPQLPEAQPAPAAARNVV